MLQIPTVSAAPRRTRSTPIRRTFAKLEALDEQKNHVDTESREYSDLISRCVALADKIISMSTKNLDDVLLKIAAAGVHADRNNDTAPLTEWTFTPSGFVCDDGPSTLLLSIRDDLRRLQEAI
ncbi:hypothetical protein Nham_3363 [Nitrobacter hamburgensis X14]|uniref:Uncharacterized protein n=1 Tax=Nitrobacter hamburgensis (strain DSM 10229 / NCIMB 13809 / X14) TaxID=323097 RepID=Q1QI53_NITHX|nr:hypothetical protein [Nitrobacter hamburgensis]ABE64094.1 hypothetical protein Nham_3363 [Nitrobacter hamburgensis X14]